MMPKTRAFLRFKFRGEKLHLSLKLHYFKGVVSNHVSLYQQLSSALYRVNFHG